LLLRRFEMKRLVPVLLVFAALYLYQHFDTPAGQAYQDPPRPGAEIPATGTAFRDGEQARGSGTVIRILSDDSDGSRHQRFIVRLPGGRTLLIAHNIDLAPRIEGIREGDTVEFYGEYAANSRGGVIHWTHHDPQGRRPGGWLRHQGRTYQ
jgi:hypothetical protein